MKNRHYDDFWMRLDNAAKIYPAITDEELTSVFRICVELKEKIKIQKFLEAVRDIEDRFPYFKVVLKAGFFWYYLEYKNLPIKVEPDIKQPCRAFGKHEFMFRVLAADNKISVEFSHILTDATGAFEFLKTLLFIYLEKCGLKLQPGLKYHRSNQPILQEEFEDAYQRYFTKMASPLIKLPKAFHVPFRPKPGTRLNVLTASISLGLIKAKAKELNVSITVYLTAVYLHSLQAIYEKLTPFEKRRIRKTLRIEVPMNLRKIFPSSTMRNFSLYVMPGIDLRLGHYTFEEIIKFVHHEMQLETDKKLIHKMISRNVGAEKNPMIKILPLFLKSLFLSRLYLMGTRQYSGVVTNFGKVDLPPTVSEKLKNFVFIPPPPNKILKINCAVVGFEDHLILSFGNITTSREFERQFITFLISQGIPVKITNS